MTLLHPARRQGRHFLNPVPTDMGGFGLMLRILPQYLHNSAETEPRTPLGPFHTDPTQLLPPPRTGLRVTWMGHSSTLLEIDGARILLDPVWDQRASPFSFLGPRRFFQPPIALADLPPLDAILVSHNHYDHLGASTIRTLAKLPCTRNARWITSLGVGTLLTRLGVPAARLTELDWTQAATLPTTRPLKITAWPARHFSGRGLRDRFRTLWSSFVLEGDTHTVYFGADSGWWEGFPEIAAQHPRPFDLTMLEIGAFHPLWGNIHLGPDNAVRAFEAMGSPGLLFPIHWGLFNLALHAWRQPIERLHTLASERRVPLFSPEPGRPTDVHPRTPHVSGWWRPSTQAGTPQPEPEPEHAAFR